MRGTETVCSRRFRVYIPSKRQCVMRLLTAHTGAFLNAHSVVVRNRHCGIHNGRTIMGQGQEGGGRTHVSPCCHFDSGNSVLRFRLGGVADVSVTVGHLSVFRVFWGRLWSATCLPKAMDRSPVVTGGMLGLHGFRNASFIIVSRFCLCSFIGSTADACEEGLFQPSISIHDSKLPDGEIITVGAKRFCCAGVLVSRRPTSSQAMRSSLSAPKRFRCAEELDRPWSGSIALSRQPTSSQTTPSSHPAVVCQVGTVGNHKNTMKQNIGIRKDV